MRKRIRNRASIFLGPRPTPVAGATWLLIRSCGNCKQNQQRGAAVTVVAVGPLGPGELFVHYHYSDGAPHVVTLSAFLNRFCLKGELRRPTRAELEAHWVATHQQQAQPLLAVNIFS